MEAMLSCIDKGCFSYPLRVQKMYIAYDSMATNSLMIKRIKKSESVKNEYVHKGANRLVHDVSRLGEDQLDIRLDFFVLNHNRKADEKLGRVDRGTVGMPHEMAFFNILCRRLLGLEPFPILASRQQRLPESVSLRGIEEDSPLFEHHGFGYLNRRYSGWTKRSVTSPHGCKLDHRRDPLRSRGCIAASLNCPTPVMPHCALALRHIRQVPRWCRIRSSPT